MIGAGLKKYAEQNGMKVDSGVAYGALRGYAATFSEGSGYKQLVIATRIADADQKAAFEAALNSVNLTSEFRVGSLNIAPNGINVIFNDTVGTMKKIEAFVDFIIPLLDGHGADKAEICNECGAPILDGGVWILRDGVAAFHVHSACANRVQEKINADNAQRKEEDNGSYASGAVGAVVGSLVGAVVWALVLMLGYMASVVGLLIGFLSEKGYTLLKGKQGKAKIAILVIAVILGVVIGTVGGYVLQVVQVMNEMEIDQSLFAELLEAVFTDSDVQGEMISNLLMGLLFAGLGVFGLLRNQSKMVAGEKIKLLK